MSLRCERAFSQQVADNRKCQRRSKSVETVFLIAICRPTGHKWQSKTLFLSIFDPRSSIVDYVLDFRLPGVLLIPEPLIEHEL